MSSEHHQPAILQLRAAERSATSAALLYARLQWTRLASLADSAMLIEAKRLEHAMDRSPTVDDYAAIELNADSHDCLHLVAKTCAQSGQPFVEDLAITVRSVAVRASLTQDDEDTTAS